MDKPRTLLERVKEHLWFYDSDDTDDNSLLEAEASLLQDWYVVRDETNGKYYRIKETDINKIDIIEVKKYMVAIEKFKELEQE